LPGRRRHPPPAELRSPDRQPFAHAPRHLQRAVAPPHARGMAHQRRHAVPGGDISPQVLESAAAAGLRALFTSEPWVVPRRVHGCWILGRYIVKASTPSARIAALAAFRAWRGALLVRRVKVAARAALPSLYRAYVARTTREWDAVAERP